MRWPVGVSAFLLCLFGGASAAWGVVAEESGGDDPAGVSAVPLAIFMGVAALAGVGVLRRTGVLRADAFARDRRDGAGAGALVWVMAAGATLLAQALGAGLGHALGPDAQTQPLASSSATMAGAYALGIGAGVLIILLLGGVARRAGLLARPVDALLGVGAFLLVYPILWCVGAVATALYALLASRQGWDPPTPVAHDTLRMLVEAPRDVWWWLVVACVVLAAPVVEELVYRGFLQTALRRIGIGGWGAVVVVSLIFTAMHASVAEPTALVVLFTLSVALGVSMERTGRLGVPIALHACFNAANLLIATRAFS